MECKALKTFHLEMIACGTKSQGRQAMAKEGECSLAPLKEALMVDFCKPDHMYRQFAS